MEIVEDLEKKMDTYIEYMKIYEYWRSGLFIELWSRAHRLTTLNNSKATRPFSCMKERPGHMTSMTYYSISGKNG